MSGSDEIRVRQLPIEHLDPTMFEPFGAVVGPETADSPHLNRSPGNMGFLWIQRALEFPKQPYLGALRYYYRGMRCEFLQKHPASTIVLIPLGGQASVIYVALDDGSDQPDLDTAPGDPPGGPARRHPPSGYVGPVRLPCRTIRRLRVHHSARRPGDRELHR